MRVFAKTLFDGKMNEVRVIYDDIGSVGFKDGSHIRIHGCEFYLDVNPDEDEPELKKFKFVD